MESKKNPTSDGQGQKQGLGEEFFAFSVDRDLDIQTVTIVTNDGSVTIPEKWVPPLVNAINGLFVEADGKDQLAYSVPGDFR